MKLKVCIMALAILSIITISGCIDNTQNLEVHEWGVFIQKHGNETSLSLAISPECVCVKNQLYTSMDMIIKT